MPGFPFPGRPGGEHDEPLLDMIIARRALPPDAPQPMHDLAQMFAALAGPAEPGELAGEAAVRAAFSRAARAGVSSAARRPVRHRRPRRSRGTARPRVRLAAVMVAAAVGLGSVLAASIDVLPSPVQRLAHEVGAPAPRGSGPNQAAAFGTARPVRSQASAATSQPNPRPGHSAGSGPASGHAGSPAPGYSPPSPASGHRFTEATCSPAPSHGPSASPAKSPHATSSPSSSSSDTVDCGGIPMNPTSTLNPSAPAEHQGVTTAP
jgi:hypothetical protein